MKLWDSGNLSRTTMLKAHGIDVEMEYELKKQEIADGYDDVFVKPGSSAQKEDKEETSGDGDAKIGRPRMDDDERNSDEENARTGAQPKPSNPEGSEPQE